jgi:peptide deformylase
MIRDVLKMGDPRLLRQARPVEAFDTPELRALLRDMRDTMAYQDGAGLAAPQIGVDLQVVIFGVRPGGRRAGVEEVPDTVLINPVITPLDDMLIEGWEGCLSIPGMRGLVPRFRHVRYQGSDEQGNEIDRTVTGFHAVVVQHEVDHLHGILYPMRMPDLTNFGFADVIFPAQDAPGD